ncbi:MAG TPA: hypothetical protein PKZ76_08760 [Xanthomonadaceae bacterium]|nr:hypothetical protein [Xanthomonadaceae bacterium]
MKTTVDIRDDLLEAAKRRAGKLGIPVRALLERALEEHLREAATEASAFSLRVFDRPRPTAALRSGAWDEMRELIYAEREARIAHDRG